MSTFEIRKQRVASLVADYFGNNQSSLGTKVKRSPNQVYQWLSGRRNIGEDLARHIEASLGLPRYWLDNPEMEGMPTALDLPTLRDPRLRKIFEENALPAAGRANPVRADGMEQSTAGHPRPQAAPTSRYALADAMATAIAELVNSPAAKAQLRPSDWTKILHDISSLVDSRAADAPATTPPTAGFSPAQKAALLARIQTQDQSD